MTFKRVAGFSLVEVIISGALVATTVGALFAAASMAIRLSGAGQDRLIASQLAREGIEVVRQIRDSNFVVDACTGNVESCHRQWTDGILATGENLPITQLLPKQVNVQPSGSTPFALVTSIDQQATCTDYIVRDTLPGAGGLTYETAATSLGPNKELFCRRIFIEPVITSELKPETIRVRSQVVWLGAGKVKLRTLGEVLAAPSPACPGVGSATAATEWCTEQVVLLTDWRKQL